MSEHDRARCSKLSTFVGTLKVPTLPFKGNLVLLILLLAQHRSARVVLCILLAVTVYQVLARHRSADD